MAKKVEKINIGLSKASRKIIACSDQIAGFVISGNSIIPMIRTMLEAGNKEKALLALKMLEQNFAELKAEILEQD